MNEVYTYKGFKGIRIGDQFWMNKNLDIGDGINNPEYPEFGKYYSWQKSEEVIPSGWKLPSTSDWEKLNKNINDSDNNVRILKSKNIWLNTKYIQNINMKGNNSIGFNAFPGGVYFKRDKNFSIDKKNAGWWCKPDENVTYCLLINDEYELQFRPLPIKFAHNMDFMLNIRCVQDWDIVKNEIKDNIDDIELDDLDDLNESMNFFKQSERFL